MIPSVATSLMGCSSTSAMQPMILKMTKPAKTLVTESKTETMMASLQRQEQKLPSSTQSTRNSQEIVSGILTHFVNHVLMSYGDLHQSIIVELVVASQCNESTPARRQREKNLHSSISPYLQTRENIHFVQHIAVTVRNNSIVQAKNINLLFLNYRHH